MKRNALPSDAFFICMKKFYFSFILCFASSLICTHSHGQLNQAIDAGKFVKANGINFYYETFGKGDTVLLLHGNSESLKSFSKQIPELSKQFFVIAMDSRGQGNSSDDGKKITYELMAEDVNAFLNKLQMKNVNILGWSDGGNTGLILAMKHPDKVRKLATMGANLYNDKTSVDEKTNKQLKGLREELTKQKVASSDIRVRMTDLLLNEPKINPDDLKAIKCPVLVMAGSEDVIKEPHTRLIASKIGKSKLVIFTPGTHYEPQENPERFNKTVMDFFTGK
ncbi:alpha/beta hydrolase [Cytophagales bacterium WSM2-2]|nr:alpha/beta hydrolase [Cytophagales bacterium WSM2-2]